MPNRRKTARNQEILNMYCDGEGLLQREIAEQLSMKESAVSMVILREKRRQSDKESNSDSH
jgi:DNA-binding NarL/FixJ family response regulator